MCWNFFIGSTKTQFKYFKFAVQLAVDFSWGNCSSTNSWKVYQLQHGCPQCYSGQWLWPESPSSQSCPLKFCPLSPTPPCKFFMTGHCKFGVSCHFIHTALTCSSLQCSISDCSLWHPHPCKFFNLPGSCRFGNSCSYWHIVTSDYISGDIVTNLKAEVSVLHDSVNILHEQVTIIQSLLEKVK